MKGSPLRGQLPGSLNLRLTPELRDGLIAAIPRTPGAASASGVARKAIDYYLTQVLKLADTG
jgi:hypothetical protein